MVPKVCTYTRSRVIGTGLTQRIKLRKGNCRLIGTGFGIKNGAGMPGILIEIETRKLIIGDKSLALSTGRI
ncbi:hypothetical protein D3C87_1912200 [compost metagenome]